MEGCSQTVRPSQLGVYRVWVPMTEASEWDFKKKWTRSVCWNYLWTEVRRVKQSFFQAGGKCGKQSRTAVSWQLWDSICPFDYKMPVFAVSTHICLLHTTVLLKSFPDSFSLLHWGGYREQPWWSPSSLGLNITRSTWGHRNKVAERFWGPTWSEI